MPSTAPVRERTSRLPDFFQSAPGTVVALNDPALQGNIPFTPIISTPDDPISFQAQKSLITAVTVGQEVNAQFLHTIGSTIYVYAFGDRIGQMTISGLAAAASCNDRGGQHGIEQILAWYKRNKLTARKSPVTMVLGQSTTVRGFVTSFNGSVFDHRFYLMQFSISMMLLPDVTQPGASGGGDTSGGSDSGGDFSTGSTGSNIFG